MKEEILEYFKDINHAYNDCTRFDTLKRMLGELQELKTGHWIERDTFIDSYDDTVDVLECSLCNFKHHYTHGNTSLTDAMFFKYCPNCGAKMSEGGEE